MKKIIIIDDDRISLDNFELAIEIDLPTFEVKTFHYPEQFKEEDINDVSLIILDIMFAGDGEFLGGYDLGLKFYRKFKEKNPTIPVIIFTNKAKSIVGEKEIKIIEDNGDLFFDKSTASLNSFLESIRKIIGLDHP